MRNEALFDKIAAQIEETPDLYNQVRWFEEVDCGTAYCIAGWALKLSGYSLGTTLHEDHGYSMIRVYKDGTEIEGNVSEKAAELLGLTETEELTLFSTGWMHGKSNRVPETLRAIGRGAKI